MGINALFLERKLCTFVQLVNKLKME